MVCSTTTVPATAAITTTMTTTATVTTHNARPTEYDLSLEERPERVQAPSSKPIALDLLKFSKIKAVLLESESISQTVIKAFEEAGYQVETFTYPLLPSEESYHHQQNSHHRYQSHLLDAIRTAHILGVGPKSRLTEQVLSYASNLLAVGCFAPNTNHIDLQAAATKGVPVYSSSFSHARSVAELVIGNVIGLARQLGDRNREMHDGVWQKVSRGCFEIRGKILGIVGYDHVGTQVSMLAEALGLRVYFYNVVANTMPFGRAQQVESLGALLQVSDFVSLHASSSSSSSSSHQPVRIGPHELKQMKPGAYLINAMASDKNSLIDIVALVDALRSGHLAGAALDVEQEYPKKKGADAVALANCPNVILTPHIACSTEETIETIGREVSAALIKYIAQTPAAANETLPDLASHNIQIVREQGDTKDKAKATRVLNIHKQGAPGVLSIRS